jgi:hypothetical protein
MRREVTVVAAGIGLLVAMDARSAHADDYNPLLAVPLVAGAGAIVAANVLLTTVDLKRHFQGAPPRQWYGAVEASLMFPEAIVFGALTVSGWSNQNSEARWFTAAYGVMTIWAAGLAVHGVLVIHEADVRRKQITAAAGLGESGTVCLLPTVVGTVDATTAPGAMIVGRF